MRSRPLLLTLLLAACPKPPPTPAPAAVPAAAPKAAPVPDCTADFPQLPLSEIPAASRDEFCKFAADNLCYCGCPHTLAGCLKEHPTCRHAARMSILALAEITVGSGSADSAAKFVTGYYDSFKPENRVKLPTETMPCQGAPDAKLTMVEFSDFDCPHCKAARPLFEKLVKDRHDLRLCFASFPLHKHSGLAAVAAQFAQKQGAFWRFHDLLFEDQDARATLDEPAYIENLVALAGKAGLDRAGLKAALTDPGVPQLVAAQRKLAEDLGIDGTPWVFLNGRVVPPFSAELYQLSLDDEVEWMSNAGKWGRD